MTLTTHEQVVQERLELSRRRRAVQGDWTLRRALTFLRKLSPPLLREGFDCGLLGSVLLKGHSTKDLDIVVFPTDTAKYSLDAAKHVFTHAMRMEQLYDKVDVLKFWRRHESTDFKHVEVWAYNNHRVDIFFMR